MSGDPSCCFTPTMSHLLWSGVAGIMQTVSRGGMHFEELDNACTLLRNSLAMNLLKIKLEYMGVLLHHIQPRSKRKVDACIQIQLFIIEK